MTERVGPMSLVRDRFQWVSYGLVAGLILGIILGWLFHGVFSQVFRFALVALLLVPLVGAFLLWRRISDRNRADQPIETRSMVVETRTDDRTPR